MRNASHRYDVIRVDFDRCALTNQADRDDETSLGGLSDQESAKTLEDAAPYLNRHTRLKEWIRIDRQGTRNQAAHILDFGLGHRNTLTAYPQYPHNTGGGQNL